MSDQFCVESISAAFAFRSVFAQSRMNSLKSSCFRKTHASSSTIAVGDPRADLVGWMHKGDHEGFARVGCRLEAGPVRFSAKI